MIFDTFFGFKEQDMSTSEFSDLLKTLRQILKNQKTTYADLAKEIGVSEGTVKRIFTSDDCSFGRISEICSALGLSVADVMQQALDQQEKVFQLTEKQERFFADHPSYYAFFHELLEERQSISEIRAKYGLNAKSLTRYLRALDRIDVIEWLPGDRVKRLFHGTHNWIRNGPLQQKFQRSDGINFLDYLIQNDPRDLHYFTGSDRYLHVETLRAMLAELKSVIVAYRKRAYRDEISYPKSDLIRTKWVVGLAPYARTWTDEIKNI
jgi:DNA-binding Xre family transcriptional regulator